MAGPLDTRGELRQQLDSISTSTVHCILSRYRPTSPRLPRERPSGSRPLPKGIPMRRIPWGTPQPGHFEVDLVHHSGPFSSGHYAHFLQMVDVATGWSQHQAILGRSWLVVCDAFCHILCHLPFTVQEVHSDNGSEFLNAHLLEFWAEAASHISLSRSRPYQKNGIRFVEQKNSCLIRAYLGHERLDNVAQTQLHNQIYGKMDCYYNPFLPVISLSEKTSIPPIDGRPARIRLRYNRSRTPCDRLCDTDAITDVHRQQLMEQRRSINPLKMLEDTYELRDKLFSFDLTRTG
jgi:hypothetical protein